MTEDNTQAAECLSHLTAELDTGIAMNLMLGDCLERMKEIPDGSIDLIFTCPIAQQWYNQHIIMRLG